METLQQTEIKNQIIEHEKKLLDAFATKNLAVIDELLHPDAIFIYPNAQTVTKAMVLNNYREGNSAFATVTSSDQLINIINDTAIVSINLQLQGKYFKETINSQFRYLRVWKFCNNKWQVIATSGVPKNAS